jgi:16S rRNA (uracil1498-N3)-methyltransferase
MTRRCFLIDAPVDDSDQTVTLSGATAHHLTTVLRIRQGDQIELRDGRGGAWLALVTRLGGKDVSVQLQTSKRLSVESHLTLTVALAYARAERMELVIRQATELGVQRLVMFRSARSQYGLVGGDAENRRQRWLKIAREALCQCGRVHLPEMVMFADTVAFLEKLSASRTGGAHGLRVLAWEEEERQGMQSLWQEFPSCRELLLGIGPEGGFSGQEAQLFRSAGFHTVQLGPRVLRLETAAVAAITTAQVLWGDLGANRRPEASPAVDCGS